MQHIKDAKRRSARRRNQWIRIAAIAAATLLLILVIFLLRALFGRIAGLFDHTGEETQQVEETIQEEPTVDTSSIQIHDFTLSTGVEEAEDTPVEITMSFMGDYTLGKDSNAAESTSFNSYFDTYGPDYFLQNVRSILSADDLSVINLEGTLTTSTERKDKKFAFKGDPSYVEVLTGSSIEAANLANNHSHDYYDESYNDTIDTLDQADIASFGYDNAAMIEVKGVRVGLAGVNCIEEESMDPDEQTVQTITALQEAGAEIIVSVFHWGIEQEYTANETQRELAHLAIDTGADLVIGHHPHVLQGIEEYKGKYIAYSLGNFCFGGNSNPEDTDTCILQETFTVNPDGTVDADEYPNIIPCSLTSSSGKNDYCPTPLTGEDAERVLDKMEESELGT